MLRFTGIYSHLKLHGKEISRKRDWRSHFGIVLGTSLIAGHAITNCTNLSSSKAGENAKNSTVESLPDWVGIVVPKIEWCSLTWSIMSHTHEQACPNNIISRFEWFVISFCHFRNFHTEYVVTRKSPQVDFLKSEKDFSLLRELLPLVCFVSSPEGLGMKYKVTHTTTHTVFQIGNWAKSLSSSLIASYLRRNLFHLPKKLYCHVLRSRFWWKTVPLRPYTACFS